MCLFADDAVVIDPHFPSGRRVERVVREHGPTIAKDGATVALARPLRKLVEATPSPHLATSVPASME
jgi:hypothetical protein